MKKLLLITVFVTAIAMCSAQGTWTMLNPNPTLKHLTDASFVSQDEGWVVGEDGLIMHTSDGGENWETQHSNTYFDFSAVFFVGEDEGYAIGSHHIYYTDDGGENWETQDHPASQGAFLDVFFINQDTGWVSGRVNTLFKTTDGGENWEKIEVNLPEPKHFYRLMFTDALHGWIAGSQYISSDGFIAVTNDGGYTWTETTPVGFSGFNDVYFLDSLNGWACGEDDAIVHTEDGGNTWTEIPVNGLGSEFQGIHINPDKSGILVNSYWAFFTFDGGLTWDSVVSVGTSASLQRFRLFDNGVGIAVGDYGAMVKTCDSGQSWQRMNKGITSKILDIGFFNPLDGMAIAGYYHADLYLTHDGGATWTMDSTLNVSFFYMMKVSGQSCYLLSASNKLYVSHNAGADWIIRDVPTIDYRYTDLQFLNENTGYICGPNGKFYKTIDGGQTWIYKSFSSSLNIRDLFFINENLGWLIEGTWEKVYRTEDGGDTWTQRPLIDYIVCQPQSLWFTSEETGYASTAEGKLFKTIDGGNSWESIASFADDWQSEILFANENEGWYMVKRKLYHSTDAGETWSGPMVFGQILNSMFFLDHSRGWVGGTAGFISTYDYIVGQPEKQQTKSMLQLQPNPATDFIRISAGNLTEIKTIRVFDVFGREVLHVDLTRNSQEYMLDLSAFDPGTYLLQTESNTGKQAAKFIKE